MNSQTLKQVPVKNLGDIGAKVMVSAPALTTKFP